MTTLAAQQQALLEALFAWPTTDAINNIANYADGLWARGLKAYQSNGHALAERAMQATYPVLTQLLGGESLGALARAFWHAHPPVRGDMAQWGGDLADFVRASEQLADEPYLADVVRVEWALHLGASAADAFTDRASFALLTQHDPGALQLKLAPGCVVVQSPWPVASIMGAHLYNRPTLDEAGQSLRDAVGECALVWRRGLVSQVAPCSHTEAEFLQAVLSGASLLAVLEHVDGFSLDLWLPSAVQSGLVLGVGLLATPSGFR